MKERVKPGMMAQGKSTRFQVLKGLVKEEQRGATVFTSSLEASVASSIVVERQTKIPYVFRNSCQEESHYQSEAV